MSTLTRSQLWQRLQQQSLVEGDLPPAQAPASPWYVRAMLGVAGWVGALFLLGFVGIGFAFVMESAAASMIVGTLCCGIAFLVFRVARDNDFAMQFGLAVSLAGQGLFIAGLFHAFEFETPTAYLLIAAFEAALAALAPNFIHRVLAGAGASFALSIALSRLDLSGVAPAIVAAGLAPIWLNERRWSANGGPWRPIGYGFALALLLIESTRLFGDGMMWRLADRHGWWAVHGPWIGSALMTVVFVWSVMRLLAHENIGLTGKAGMASLAAAIAVGVVSFAAPGVAAALLILLFGFASGNRILMGLGLFGLLGFVSHYYYQLQATLMVKSIVLAATGATLLTARLALRRYFPLTAEEEDSDA